MSNFVIITILSCLIAWFYFNKFKESEKEYFKLHKKCSSLQSENCKLKNRLKDLQTYKNDVSKTFKILDNELLMINDQLQKQTQNSSNNNPTIEDPLNFNNRISILSPDILQSLFFNMNQERIYNPNENSTNLESSGDLGNIIHSDIELNKNEENSDKEHVISNLNNIKYNSSNEEQVTSNLNNNQIDLLRGLPNNKYDEYLL